MGQNNFKVDDNKPSKTHKVKIKAPKTKPKGKHQKGEKHRER